MIDAPAVAGPFRGPRSFQTGDALYGRDREARALLATLVAERIVLLHSPSGAGKTSLVQAALVPMLAEREFSVLPVVRVGTAPAPGGAANRYLRSTLLSLEEGRPADEQLPAAELEALTLAAYLARRVPTDADPVLIFDQFEELLTRDPTDIAAKHAFFEQLGAALRERRYRALFSMREDFVAALEPYLRHLPTRLGVHFRLDLLGAEGARQALAEPVRGAGVAFADELVAALVDDLRVVNVQGPDGAIAQQLGPSVEPVQLQVLGLRLWQRLAPGAPAISAADVAAVGDVNSALGDYYAEQVAAVAAAAGVGERAVRAWFDRELITPLGVRGQVLQGQGVSAGLPNAAVRALVDAYLVRAEPRRGATWFELAHDRLIAPVRASNAAWEEANLSALQRQAELWERQGRPAGLLLRDQTLLDAERWAAANPAELTPVDQAFLQLCRDARRQARRVRNLAVGASILAVAATLAFLAALWLFGRAEEQRREAERNARLSRSRELAAAADVGLPADPERSLLLGLAAVDATRAAGEPVTPEAELALRRAVLAARAEASLAGHAGGLRALAYSPDGATLATAGADGAVLLWDLASGERRAALSGHADAIYALAYSPDGATLATAGADGTVILWDPAAAAERGRLPGAAGVVFTDLAYSPDGALLAAAADDGTATLWGADGEQLLSFPAAEDNSLDALAFSPDGATFATGDSAGVVLIWDLGSALAFGEPGAPLLELIGPVDSLTDLAYSPDGALLAAASLDLNAFVWDTADGASVAVLAGHAGSLYSVAFSPGGDLLATASFDGTAKVWRLDVARPALTLAGHGDYVYDVAFAPGGGQLATAGLDGTARLWSLAFAPADGAFALAAAPGGAQLATAGAAGVQLWDAAGADTGRLPGPDDGPSALAYSPDGATLAVGGVDGVVRLWDVADPAGEPAGPARELAGHTGAIARLAYSPDGARLASASDDATVRVWDPATGDELLLLEGFTFWVFGLAYSPDGARLAAADQDGTLIVWDAASGAELARVAAGRPFTALAYSPDGALLAASADDGTITRYDAAGAALGALEHGAPVSHVAYGPDGALASAGLDGVVRLWGPDGRPAGELPAPAGVYAVAYLPEGRLAAVGADGVVHIFPLGLDDLIGAARAQLTRGPTAEECAAYRLEAGCP